LDFLGANLDEFGGAPIATEIQAKTEPSEKPLLAGSNCFETTLNLFQTPDGNNVFLISMQTVGTYYSICLRALLLCVRIYKRAEQIM
jgi:hypothetical protein